jgi:RNA polymerase sigma factor for flagellar operon FliA
MGVQVKRSERNALILEYEVLVDQIASSLMKRFSLQPVFYDELVSAGYLGLVESADRCGVDVQGTFQAYAAIRIRGAMIDALRNSSVLSRRSHRFVKAMYAMQHLREEDMLEQGVLKSVGRSPTQNLNRVIEIASKGGLAFQLSADEASAEMEAKTSDELLPDDKVHAARTRALLEAAVDQLPDKEKSIVRGYYFEDKSFVSIAEENRGMNKSWVSKLHARAINRLREIVDESEL